MPSDKVAQVRDNVSVTHIWELVYALTFHETPSRPDVAIEIADDSVREFLTRTGQIEDAE